MNMFLLKTRASSLLLLLFPLFLIYFAVSLIAVESCQTHAYRFLFKEAVPFLLFFFSSCTKRKSFSISSKRPPGTSCMRTECQQMFLTSFTTKSDRERMNKKHAEKRKKSKGIQFFRHSRAIQILTHREKKIIVELDLDL